MVSRSTRSEVGAGRVPVGLDEFRLLSAVPV